MLALISGSIFSTAQELQIPERWTQCLKDVPELRGHDTLTICILGDVMMHSAQIADAMQADSTFRFDCFRHVKGIISEADIAIANMEFTLAGKPYSGYPAFSAPESYASYVAECGVDVFLTANNHILDKKSKGAERTLEIYDRMSISHGIRHTGSSRDQAQKDSLNPLMIRRMGYNIALLNMTYGTNLGSTAAWPEINYLGERQKIEKALSKAEENGAEISLVLPHWGEEYNLRHSQIQEQTAEWLAESGADIIIGAHPHVVQDLQLIGERGVQVAYSLGNAVSNMSAANTQIGLMATISITRDLYGNAVILPVEFTYLWCSRPGGYTDTYMVLPVKEFIGTRNEWKGRWEYDKMMSTYSHVMEETGITDTNNE